MTNDSKVEIRCPAKEKYAWFRAAGGSRNFSKWARSLLSSAVESPPNPIPDITFYDATGNPKDSYVELDPEFQS